MSMSSNHQQSHPQPQQTQTQWQPPIPSHASLPVDRTKTEPKPAFYKLQFGDDLTGFSYYVRTLTVVIGRNVASLVPQLPPDRLNVIDGCGDGDGKGGILPPPDERNLGGPTIPPLGLEAGDAMLVDEKPVLSDLDFLQDPEMMGMGEDMEQANGLGDGSETAGAGAGSAAEDKVDGSLGQNFSDIDNLDSAFFVSEPTSFEPNLLKVPDRTRAVSETEVEVKLEQLESANQDVQRSKSFDHADFLNGPAISMHDLEISEEALNQAVADISYGEIPDHLASDLFGGEPSFPPESPGLSPAALEALALAATSTSPPPPPPPPLHTASDSLEHVDVDLGPLKSVSRNHAKISYITELGHFCLEIYGRNGAWVDDRYFVRGSIVPLNQGSQIQIATRIFSFILPPSPGSSPYHTPYESYSLDELPYPYNLPAQDVGYQEFYGEGGPGPSSAAALATRFPEQYNVFTAPDGHGLGLAMDSHGWLNDWSDRSGDRSEVSDSDSDSDSDDDDEEDYDEEDSEEESSEEEVVEEKPKPIPKIRIKVKRPPKPESDLSSVSSEAETPAPAPAPPPAVKAGTTKAKAATKKSSPQKAQSEVQLPPPPPPPPTQPPTAQTQPPLAVKQPAKSKKQAATKGGKGKAAVKDEVMDVDPAPSAPPEEPMTLAKLEATTAEKASEEVDKEKEKDKDKDAKVKAVPEKPKEKEKDKPKAKTEKAKSTPAKKESKKKSKAAAIAPAPVPPSSAPGPPPVPTLASATASMSDIPPAGPPGPPPATTLAAVEAQNPGPPPPPASQPMPVRPVPPPPPPPQQQQMGPQVRPPPMPPVAGPVGPSGPMQARPPPQSQPQSHAGPSTPGPRPAPGHPGQPVPPTTPQVARPPAPGPVRPPIVTTPSSSNTGTPEPMKPFVLTELIETPGRAGHILVNVPIPPSGAGPRPPPGPLIGLDAQPFIGPPPLKPTSTFATIIHRALLFLPRGRGTLGEVCNWVAGEWEWFRLNIDAGWQNSIRHNLSLNKAFLKVPRIPEDDPESKGSVWIIDPKEGPKFEEKQRKDAMKAEGKGKNSDVRREKERIRVEERQKKLRDMPHDHPSNSQGPSQSSSSSSHHPNQQQGSYQQRPTPGPNNGHPHAHAQHAQARPIAATSSVRPTPRPVSTQSTTGISKGLPAKGKIAVTITPITAMLRQKSVIATTDQNGKALPFTCDGSTLSLDQQTFGHLTADILEKLTVLGPAQAVEVISAWVINKNKQMAAASAGKANAAGAGTAGRPASAAIRPHANGTSTQAQGVRPGGATGNATRPPPARPVSAQSGSVRPPATPSSTTTTNGATVRPPATATSSGSVPTTSGANTSTTAPNVNANVKPSVGAASTTAPASTINPTTTTSQPTPASAATPSTAPTTMTIKGKVIGPAPPGASLTRVISMIAEVANAKGDVNIVGPNASALLRYIRVVGVDIDLKVADRIWATGVLPPLPMKKGQGVNAGKQAGAGGGGMKPPTTGTSAGAGVGANSKPNVPGSAATPPMVKPAVATSAPTKTAAATPAPAPAPAPAAAPAFTSTPAPASVSATLPPPLGNVPTTSPAPAMTGGAKRKLESPPPPPRPAPPPPQPSGSASVPPAPPSTGAGAATASVNGNGNSTTRPAEQDRGPSEMKKPKLETAGGS